MQITNSCKTIAMNGYVDMTTLQSGLQALREGESAEPSRRCAIDCSAVTGFTAEAVIALADAVKQFKDECRVLALVNLLPDVLAAMRRIVLLELLERELRAGMGERARKMRAVLADAVARYQYFWNN